MVLSTRRFSSRVLLVGLIVTAMLTAAAAARVTYQRFRIVEQIRSVDAEIARLKQEKEELERTRDMLNDFATIEKSARELLGLRREGENVVILLPSGEHAVAAEEVPVAPPPEPSNPVKWWEYFFGE